MFQKKLPFVTPCRGSSKKSKTWIWPKNQVKKCDKVENPIVEKDEIQFKAIPVAVRAPIKHTSNILYPNNLIITMNKSSYFRVKLKRIKFGL